MQTDLWAVSPAATSDAYYRASAAIGAGGPITLLQSSPGQHGVGYKVVITSTGDERTKTFTLIGIKVGDLSGRFTTEIITGPNATTVNSTNYYSYIDSISINAASVGNVKIGYVAGLALPRTRIKTVYYVGGTSAGTIIISSNTTGVPILNLDTPASSTAAAFTVLLPENGLLTTRSTSSDFALVALTNVTYATFICG